MFLTPDCKHVVSVSYDKTIRVTRIKDGKLIRETHLPEPIYLEDSVCVNLDVKHFMWTSRTLTMLFALHGLKTKSWFM